MKVRKDRNLFFKRLEREIEGEVCADLFSRGRYATDASIYQCFPAGVVAPRVQADVAIILENAPRGRISTNSRRGSTFPAGPALGEGPIVNFSKYLNKNKEIDPQQQTCIL